MKQDRDIVRAELQDSAENVERAKDDMRCMERENTSMRREKDGLEEERGKQSQRIDKQKSMLDDAISIPHVERMRRREVEKKVIELERKLDGLQMERRRPRADSWDVGEAFNRMRAS
jgi:hypothetical protein